MGDEFLSSFPLIFTGVLFAAFGFQYVKKQITELELDITLPEPTNGGLYLIYGFFFSPALVLGAVFAKEAGAPIPSVERPSPPSPVASAWAPACWPRRAWTPGTSSRRSSASAMPLSSTERGLPMGRAHRSRLDGRPEASREDAGEADHSHAAALRESVCEVCLYPRLH